MTARIVAATEDEDTGAKELATMLTADVALAGRVTKLANSAYFGMMGRVTTLQHAVTVVGFTAVRTLATVALTDVDDESRLPDGFWTTGATLGGRPDSWPRDSQSAPLTRSAWGCSPSWGRRCCTATTATATGSCWPTSPRSPAGGGRRNTGTAYRRSLSPPGPWNSGGSPLAMITPLRRLDDPTAAPAGLLPAAYEVVSRLTVPGHQPVAFQTLTRGAVTEDALPPILGEVRAQADGLRRLLLGD